MWTWLSDLMSFFPALRNLAVQGLRILVIPIISFLHIGNVSCFHSISR